MNNGQRENDVVILAGARTPFGNFGGALRQVSAVDLAVAASKGAIARGGIPAERIDDVVFGNVVHTSSDAIYLARHIALKAGLPIDVPALTLNRLCGSGLQAIISAAQSLMLGETTYALAGGTESMSNAPHVIRGARWGLARGQGGMEDSLWEALVDSYGNIAMAITAENLASQYGISREASDEFALASQAKALVSAASGYFTEEIVSIEVPGAKGSVSVVDRDEGPRAGLTMEKLAKLPARFKKDGVVTPANASGITDGAAAVVLTTLKQAKADGVLLDGKVGGLGRGRCRPLDHGDRPRVFDSQSTQSGGHVAARYEGD